MSTPAATDAQRNVELLSRFMNYLNDAGLAAMGEEVDAFVHPEIEWIPGLLAQGKRVYRGREEYRAYIEEASARAAEGNYLNVNEIRAVGEDRVLVLAWVHYTGEKGPHFDGEYALLASIEDGLIRSLRSFLSRAEAERAAVA